MGKEISLHELTEHLAEKVPDFAAALRDEDTYLAFCKRLRADLKQLRKSMGITQSELADKLQMSQSAVARIEKGEGDIGFVTLCRYAGALGLQPSVSFVPSTDMYFEPKRLKAAVKAMERLAEVRSNNAEEALVSCHAAFQSKKYPGVLVPPSTVFAAAASTMNSALMQTISTEMIGMLSALSILNSSELLSTERTKKEKRDVAST